MSSPSPAFSILDYTLFALTLSISAAIGIFYAIRAWRKKEGVEAFLTGSRRMPLLPTAISLLVSFISGISIISYPAEVYTYGLVFLWVAIGGTLAPVVSGLVILPVLHRMRNSVSIYAYFEYRFRSKLLRCYGSLLYQSSTIIYLSVVLYAPSISLAGVTGINARILIVTVGLICTLYTSIGGLKAVVWSDTFQAIIMYTGLLALAIQGTLSAGGVKNVFDTASASGRLQGFLNVDPNPLQYMTTWTGLFGGLFYWLASFGSDQTALQRYCSLPTIKKARVAVFLNAPSMLFVMALVIYIGLTMTAKYVACDPRLTEKALQKDQVVIYYMMETLGNIYGLPGLFLACIFSGTLSSVSSGVNALSAVFLEDFVKPLRRKRPLTDRQATVVTKVTGAIYGTLAVALAFAAGPLGGIFKTVMSAYGALSGPLAGMLLLGIMFPCANKKGALFGTVVASAVSMWIFVGCTVYDVAYPELPTYIDGCTFENGTGLVPASNQSFLGVATFNGTQNLFTPDLQGVNKLYAISYIVYPCISACLTLGLGLIVSLVTGGNGKGPENRRLTFWSSVDDDPADCVGMKSKEDTKERAYL